MIRNTSTALAPLLLLVACSQQAQQDRLPDNVENHADAPLSPPPPGEPGGLPADRTPVAEGPIDPRSAQGAGLVLQNYFALLESGRYAQAYRLWSDAGRASGRSIADFAAGFGKYAEYHANIGAPGRMEGAAGSTYVDVPVQVYGRLKNGRQFAESGTATLRRVNDVPGSTAEQREWRIYRMELEPQARPASYRFVGRWAADAGKCAAQAWRFTEMSLRTPAGSVCAFKRVLEVPGGYDIAARCTAEGPPADDTLELRFAESAKALLFESDLIADAGLVRCR